MKSLKITLSLLFFLGLFSTVTFAAESFAVVEEESSQFISETDNNEFVQDKKLTNAENARKSLVGSNFLL